MSTTGQAVACACGQRFLAPAQLAGRRVKCPACGHPIDVPALAAGSVLDAAAQAMQSLPAVSPLHGRTTAAAPTVRQRAMPAGLWIGLGIGGGVLLLLLMCGLGLRMVGQRLIADNIAKAKAAAREAAAPGASQPTAPKAGPQVYQSPTARFSVEFPGRPKRELVRSSEPGGLSHWEANLTLGEFLRGRGEQFLVTETIRTKSLTDEKIESTLEQLVNATAGIDVGRGRILTSKEI